jgi:hypothetical protein
MRPLLVRDKPDALGETWCWRFALLCWGLTCWAAIVLAAVVAVKALA